MDCVLRLANRSDIPVLQELIDASVRGLAREHYTARQIECALQTAFTVDTQLIDDGTFFVVEEGGKLAGCGGWSCRSTLCGGDHHAVRENALLDPARDAAKIRAIFVHPAYARKGIGGMILHAAEEAARAAGFRLLEMGATLTGVSLYLRSGYCIVEEMSIPVGPSEMLTVVRMRKRLSQ
jgi:N-acetylglutamate synthase-like GNAT family acetyltransferase